MISPPSPSALLRFSSPGLLLPGLVFLGALLWSCTAPEPGTPADPSAGGGVAEDDPSMQGAVVDADPQELDGEWWVIELEGSPVERDRTRRRRPHVRFDSAENRISFTGGCNQFAGTVAFEDPGGIDLGGPFAGTKMLCPGRADYDEALTAALQAAVRWRLVSPQGGDDPVLELLAESGTRVGVRLVRPREDSGAPEGGGQPG